MKINLSQDRLKTIFGNTVIGVIAVTLVAGLAYQFMPSNDLENQIKAETQEKVRISKIPQTVTDFAAAQNYVDSGIYAQNKDGLCFLVDIGNPSLIQMPVATHIPCTEFVLKYIQEMRKQMDQHAPIPN